MLLVTHALTESFFDVILSAVDRSCLQNGVGATRMIAVLYRTANAENADAKSSA